jgi:hypothetical protein
MPGPVKQKQKEIKPPPPPPPLELIWFFSYGVILLIYKRIEKDLLGKPIQYR